MLTGIIGLFPTGIIGRNALPPFIMPPPGDHTTPRNASTVPVEVGVRKFAAPAIAKRSESGSSKPVSSRERATHFVKDGLARHPIVLSSNARET